MFVFLDIGFTLIGGPGVGPARRLAEALALPGHAKPILSDLLFRSPFSHPDQLAEALHAQFHGLPEQSRAVVHALWQAQSDEAYILPGAAELLETLTEARIPFGFISNIWAPFHAGFTRLFPQESRQHPSFLSFQLQMAKPDLALYQTALRQTGVSPRQAIMIGDTYGMDIAPPQQLGMKTVWILHRPQQELADTLHILNGRAPAPDLALAHIGQVQVEQLHTLLTESKHAQ
ncbi:MAG: HAD-IA family hydrolase [Magnetococcales bacterium]|nr:HAD-IA family hydrolase [Magnetococcales bacterium]